ncbi:MAG: hypothetical protein BWK77_05670, partial [Verrucomicrobia bacterium A1]
FDYFQLTEVVGGLAVPGTIQIENFDAGGEGVAYHDTTVANEGGAYRPTERVDIAASTGASNGYLVGWTKLGEWLKYTVNVAVPGLHIVRIRVASLLAGGTFHIEQDNVNVSGTLTVPNTGGWFTWTTVTGQVNLTAGVHVLKLVMDAVGVTTFVGNFDQMTLVGPPAVAPEARSVSSRAIINALHSPSAPSTGLTRSWLVDVRTSDDVEPDEAGWAAVDGDATTAWVGQAGAGGWWLAMAYGRVLSVRSVDILFGEDSLTNSMVLFSEDADQWTNLKDVPAGSAAAARYLWLIMPDDGSGAVPSLQEINVK